MYAGVLVADAADAFEKATANGVRPALAPTTLRCEASATEQVVAEVELYGDVRLRFVSGSYKARALRV